jgi:hypothetical protein
MGLDSYLEKNIDVYARYGHVTGKIELFENGKPIPINFDKVERIRENVAHWKYAYHIHNWLLDNGCEYSNPCKEEVWDFPVKREKIVELLEICKKIKAKHKLAKKLLPEVVAGKYDKSYYESIDYTIEALEEGLNNSNNDFFWYDYWD